MNDDYVVTYSVNNGHHHHHCVVPPIRNRKLATVSRELENLLHEVAAFKAATARLETAMFLATPLTTNKIIIDKTLA